MITKTIRKTIRKTVRLAKRVFLGSLTKKGLFRYNTITIGEIVPYVRREEVEFWNKGIFIRISVKNNSILKVIDL